MGLSAPKNRVRISQDPQNTTWANNTSRFGHRILTSHGWTPGSSLGAVDAAHSSHYTAASSSHIRVLLKEDTLGLGAKRGSERPENFGLAGLASVLGRLNGNAADVKKEEERRVEVERKNYVASRFGYMTFVSGGFLVGDKIEKRADIKERERREAEEGVKIKIEEGTEEGKSKKRKRVKDEEGVIKVESGAEDGAEEPRLKRKKKSMNLREAADADVAKAEKKKEKKKSKKSSAAASEPEDTSSIETPQEPLSDKAKRKAEKRARKEEKKLKKALKKAAKEAARAEKKADSSDSSSEEESSSTATPVTSAPTTGTSTPSGLTFAAGGRHAARARYIRSKKMAGMDPQALKEIFMVKTPS